MSPLPIISNQLGFGIQPVILIIQLNVKRKPLALFGFSHFDFSCAMAKRGVCSLSYAMDILRRSAGKRTGAGEFVELSYFKTYSAWPSLVIGVGPGQLRKKLQTSLSPSWGLSGVLESFGIWLMIFDDGLNHSKIIPMVWTTLRSSQCPHIDWRRVQKGPKLKKEKKQRCSGLRLKIYHMKSLKSNAFTVDSDRCCYKIHDI